MHSRLVRSRRSALPLALWCMLTAGSLVPGDASAQHPRDVRAARLRALALLDGTLHRFHPDVATRLTGWDSIFAAHVVAAADAADAPAYRREVDAMLRALGDPQTRVAAPAHRMWVATSDAGGGVMVRNGGSAGDRGALLARVAGASHVIIDLRGGAASLPEAALAPHVLGRGFAAAAKQALSYVSLPDTQWNTRQQYHRAWELRAGETYSAGTSRPVTFLVDGESVLPALASALRRAGSGVVIGIGVTRVAVAARTDRLEMGEGVGVEVRTGRRLVDTAGVGLAVDTTVRTEAEAVAAAVSRRGRAGEGWPEALHDTAGVVPILPAPTVGSWAADYPSRGYRLLAAARLWSTMHWFFPYMREAGESWDDAFDQEAPRIEGAADALAFAQAVARLAWHLHDSHVRVYGDILWRDFYGDAPASAVVQFVERRLVVIGIADQAAARAGLAVGDEVLSVDGEPVPSRVARLAPYFVSSTPQALRTRVADFVLAGRDTEPARLVVRGANGQPRRVAIPRSRGYPPPSFATFREGPVVRVLPGKVGYVDLERLTMGMVDSALAAIADTRALVLDGRGYPASPAWVRLTQHLHAQAPPPIAARFEEYVIASPGVDGRTTRSFSQSTFPAAAPRYTGRTALLIDERAISQAEHLGLHFRAANGTIFVGSPTMGADGGVTSVQLPGRLRVSFTGVRVTHPDGRPLQRVGLQPDVMVTPTVAGIRAGRDEVLERAVTCLLDSACPSRGPGREAPAGR